MKKIYCPYHGTFVDPDEVQGTTLATEHLFQEDEETGEIEYIGDDE